MHLFYSMSSHFPIFRPRCTQPLANESAGQNYFLVQKVIHTNIYKKQSVLAKVCIFGYL
jgi:hypothetical protein